MFGFGKREKTVTVEFVDIVAGRSIGRVAYPVDRLPESFESAVTLEIDGAPFTALTADPLTAEGYRKRGSVKVTGRLGTSRRMDAVRPPFGVATIAGDVAPVEPASSRAGKRVYLLAEDDWRQVEFVALAHQALIDDNLAAIRAIRESATSDDGDFNSLQIRLDLPMPLGASSITVDETRSVFEGEIEPLEGVSYLGVAGLVAGGFAWRSGSLSEYYGHAHGGQVAAFCLGALGDHEYESIEVQNLADFAFEKGLCLVDWANARQLLPDTDEFFQFFDPPPADGILREAPL